MTPPKRARLPNRRPSHTETLQVDGQIFEATVGFDPQSGQPREIFLKAGKEGSMLNAQLADAAVVISVALQYGIPATALSKSVGRRPDNGVSQTSQDDVARPDKLPASLIGAALDLLRWFEDGATE